jgi:hypothetical protein
MYSHHQFKKRGMGFVDELDYIKEAQNAEIFMEAIAKTPLRDSVFAPPVVKQYSSRRYHYSDDDDDDLLKYSLLEIASSK